ncbi:D-alanyl-D-alanine carboxypeptidase family protein [Paenibacillus gansuensis]|uniref:D-alanyl-D-alanine carboxypeptidase family protein n=1 Tax=Paenibacillus gansuensis TaxID=306542 RepID=A0ABW5PJY6_9BACL
MKGSPVIFGNAPVNRYEDFILLSPQDVHKGQLILVNQEHPVQTEAEHLITLPSPLHQSSRSEEKQLLLSKTCMSQLHALLEECEAVDEIEIVSGFRSKETQQLLYEDTLVKRGAEYTAKYVALPGASEHQTGLAVDVGLRRGKKDYIAPGFPDTGISGLFKKKAADFGFIRRYQKSKSVLTGIADEPWHYRYVGFPHSAIMEQLDLCLEEYISYLKEFNFGDTHLYVTDGHLSYEIYYVAAKEDFTLLPVPQHMKSAWEVSGNNADGFIMTAVHSERGAGND